MSVFDRGGNRPDAERLAGELDNVEEVSERVRLAGLALSAPLADLRQAQMNREAARAAARYGDKDPETLKRAADAGTAAIRFGQLRTELARARVTPAVPKDGGAAVSGIVTRGGRPLPDATVSILSAARRDAFVCTSAAGGFALDAPAATQFRLSVSLKDEGELYRDRRETTLQPGQAIFRDIELDGAAKPCPEPPDEPPPPTDATFPMVKLVGQLEADARRLIAAQNLVLGDRKEKEDKDQAGRVIDQSPATGAKVKAGDSVAIVVATDGTVEVPQVLGLSREDARLTLAKAELTEGKIGRREAPPELEGRVVTQSPEPRARAARRSAVDLEIGVPKRPQVRRADPGLARVASLALHRLGEEGAEGEGAALEERLAKAKVRRVADLDKLLDGDRGDARDRLGLRTLAETDRLLGALRRARKELDE
ncbi:MAG: PASTA domain-containing protein [Allosphingosinicella sp.]